MTSNTHSNYLRTVFLGLAGFGFGILILSVGNNPLNAHSGEFVSTPQFWVWLILIGGQTALWSALAPSLWNEMRSLGGITENVKQFLLLILALLLASVFIVFVRPIERPLFWHEVKMGSLQLCGLATALLAIHGMGLIYRKLDGVKPESGEAKPPNESVKSLVDFKQRLEHLLLAAGTIIGAATLATGALRSALVVYKNETEIGFPKEYVLLYGLIYSMFLAAVYLPVHMKLQKKGRELRDRLIPIPKGDQESWAGWYSNRKALDDLLQLQLNPVASLFSGISILTPLAGSIVGLLIGK